MGADSFSPGILATAANPMAVFNSQLGGGEQQAFTPPGNATVIGRMVTTESERNVVYGGRPAAGINISMNRTATAGKRTVVQSLFGGIIGGAVAPGAGVVEVIIRDGATGAGTILWSKPYAIPGANAVTLINEPDIKVQQPTVASILTIEFRTVLDAAFAPDANTTLRLAALYIEVT